MKRMIGMLVLGLLVGAVCVAQEAEPESATTQPTVAGPPKPTPVPLQWEFKFEHEPLRCIPLRLPDDPRPRLFWYLRYTVTNLTDEDHVFVPEFVLYTDTGQVLRAGQSVPTKVFGAIKELYNDPLLKTQTSVTRKILRGRDNAQSGVAIWRDFDPQAGTVDLFVGGLSGETVSIRLPEPVKVTETNWKGEQKTVTKDKLILSKTLHLRYAVPGEQAARRGVQPKLVEKDWVMR